jgi:hypothetical protein
MSFVFDEMVGYLKLAQAYRSRSMLPDRDRALIVAAVLACHLQMYPLAELCRRMILQNNPGHMLRKFHCVADAIRDADFDTFFKQVRRKIPRENITGLLEQMEYRCEVRKSDFTSESEYAAAVLGLDVAWIKENFGDP